MRLPVDPLVAMLALVSVVPAVLGVELLNRGVLYSLLERRSTTVAIVGYSRASTGSVLPALIGMAASVITAGILLAFG